MKEVKGVLKIRIATGDNVVIGPGKSILLRHIIESGSISGAAKSMQMSYRRAWELVDVMNQNFDQPLVVTSPHGAEVTEFGLYILKQYEQLIEKTNQTAQQEIEAITQHLVKTKT